MKVTQKGKRKVGRREPHRVIKWEASQVVGSGGESRGEVSSGEGYRVVRRCIGGGL